MKEYLKRLQQQPREVKSRVAFVGAFIVTAVVALIWASTLSARFGEVSDELGQQTATLQDAIPGKVPSKKNETPQEATKPDDLRTRIDGMVNSLKSERENTAPGASPETSSSSPKIMIEVVDASSTEQQVGATTSKTSTTRPIIIEARPSASSTSR